MIIILVFVAILIGAIFLIREGFRDNQDGYIAGGILIILVSSVVNIGTFWTSFSTAVDADVIRDGLIAEYKSAITVYEGKMIVNVKDLSYTDFKYEGYQKNVAEMVVSIRDLVHKHNNILISKRAYRDNPFFGFYISMPKSDQPIHMIEKDEKPPVK